MRNNMISQAVQDYLKKIYKLQTQQNDTVSTTDISKELGVSSASVTGMLKRLAAMAFVEYSSYKGVKLTAAGEKIALEIIRHHRLLETYLKELLNYPLDKIHDEACRLEHVISEEFADKITEMLGNPTHDPHGHPIPSKDGKITESKETPLSDCASGINVVIRRLNDEDSKLLGYLEKIGLIPNVKFEILDKAPFNGPITIKQMGDEKILGHEVASSIFVEIENN